MLTILLILLLSAFGMHYLKKSKSSLLLVALTLLLYVGTGSGVLTQPMLTHLQAPYLSGDAYEWSQNNVIVLLGAGSEKLAGTNRVEPGLLAFGRIEKTAQAYQDCKKFGRRCIVVISGGDPLRHGLAEADAYLPELQKFGVSSVDIMLENKSLNTWQNAQFCAALLKQNGLIANDKIILVTSGVHMRRSLTYFKHFGLQAQPLRADYASVRLSWLPTAYNLMLTDAALHEYVGEWRYQLYSALGWNMPVAKAGVS